MRDPEKTLEFCVILWRNIFCIFIMPRGVAEVVPMHGRGTSGAPMRVSARSRRLGCRSCECDGVALRNDIQCCFRPRNSIILIPNGIVVFCSTFVQWHLQHCQTLVALKQSSFLVCSRSLQEVAVMVDMIGGGHSTFHQHIAVCRWIPSSNIRS